MLREPKYIMYDGKSLQEILDDHNLWWYGNGGQSANLQSANLQRANLQSANLRSADLRSADLQSADLRSAKFIIAGVELVVDDTMSNFHLLLGSAHHGYRIDDYIRIGCQEHTVQHWLANVETIAKDNNYTDRQIKEYAALVKLAADMF